MRLGVRSRGGASSQAHSADGRARVSPEAALSGSQEQPGCQLLAELQEGATMSVWAQPQALRLSSGPLIWWAGGINVFCCGQMLYSY